MAKLPLMEQTGTKVKAKSAAAAASASEAVASKGVSAMARIIARIIVNLTVGWTFCESSTSNSGRLVNKLRDPFSGQKNSARNYLFQLARNNQNNSYSNIYVYT